MALINIKNINMFRGAGTGGRRRSRPIDRLIRSGEVLREPSFFERVIQPALEKMAKMASSAVTKSGQTVMREKLAEAGLARRMTVTQVLAAKMFGALTLPFVFLFIVLTSHRLLAITFTQTTLLVALAGGVIYGAVLGFMLPDLVLNFFIRKRRRLIQITLPDMTDLMATCVEAGLGLSAAVSNVAARFRGPLAEEFQRALWEIQMGRTHSEALRDMAKRWNVEDLTAFVNALIQAEQFGLPLSNVLRVQSEQIRERRFQQARERAQKAPAKMMIPLVFFIFPVLFVFLLGPVFLRAVEALRLFGR